MSSVFAIADEITIRGIVADTMASGFVTAPEIEEEVKKIVNQERIRRNAQTMSALWAKDNS